MYRKIIIAIAVIMMFAVSAFAQTSQGITLKPGFNFISFTTDISITPQQFKSLNGAVLDIYLYSANAGGFLSLNEGTLTSLSKGKGYIVKIDGSSDVTLNVSGAAISSIGSITLKSGFNLVGFSKVPAATTFVQLMNSYTLVKGIYKWSPNAGGFIQVIRDNGGVPVQIDNVDPTFKAGESYFFNLTGDTTINYDGTSIILGASPVDPNANPATISGTINSSSASAPQSGLSYQSSGETFNVTLLDSDGNTVSTASLASGETNPKIVVDGQSYSFKVKDFTKAYKIVATGTTSVNKMISVFVGKVKESDVIANRNANPVSTAMSLIYADASKDATTYQQEETSKTKDIAFMAKLASFVSDLETKRQSIIKDQTITTASQLEAAYKDAVIGSLDVAEIATLKEGLDAVIGKIEAQLTLLEKLKNALALIATSGLRENESSVKSAQAAIATILSGESTDASSANAAVYKDAKIAYGLVCNDLGEIYTNNVNQTSSAAANAPSLMAAYQSVSGTSNALAQAEFQKGYNAVKNINLSDADIAAGRDKSLAAAMLVNAAELAKTDSAKLDEAKQKADVLISKFESESTLSVQLPTGLVLNKDRVLELKGDALINSERPAEAVEVFNEIGTANVKNFGLGRAYLKLNDIESAYKGMKDAVKEMIKSGNGSQMRMSAEANFRKVNEALFAFAAVVDRIKNAPASETALTQIKQKLMNEEQGASLEGDKILVDQNVTIAKIIRMIKPTTNFFAIGKKLVLDNSTQNFGQQYVDLKEETDQVKKAFNDAMTLLVKANELITKSRLLANIEDRKKIIYSGADNLATIEAPAAVTALKFIKDAKSAFEVIFNNQSAEVVIRGNSRFHMGLCLLANFHALKAVEIENKEILMAAKNIFLEIREKVAENLYAHLGFALAEMIRAIENIENQSEGVVAETGGLLEAANAILKRAMSFYNGKEYKLAIEEFQKAFDKFDEAYKSADSKITVKMKEAALYFSAYCLHYKYKLMSVKNETLKAKLQERLKLFTLKFPDSGYLNYIRDIINELDSIIALPTNGEVIVDLSGDVKPAAGIEFAKAMALIEKLRLYYNNNYSTLEIETAFSSIEAVIKAIIEDGSIDAKYIGNITGEVNLKHFRAQVKFQRAVMYMERYVLYRIKDTNYKNIALKLFNELITDFPEEAFIAEVKKFVLQLQNEGQAIEQFVEGRPIFADVYYSPRVVDLASNAIPEVNVSVTVIVPDTTAVDVISSVKVDLKRFGNVVYTGDSSQTPITATLVRNATNKNKWDGKLALGQSITAGIYDAIVTAVTVGGVKAETVFPVTVKSAAATSMIKYVEIVPGPALKVVTEGTDSVVYVSVMQNTAVSSSMDSKLTPVAGVAANIKLDAVSGEARKFILNIKEKLPTLKAGNYVFLFKLISAASTDIETSLNNPVHILQFPYFVKQDMLDTDKVSLSAAYAKIVANFNDLSKTGTERVAAYEKMFVTENFTLATANREIWIKFMDSVENFKITVDGDLSLEYDPNVSGRVIIRAPWKVEGKYKTDLFRGLFLPDGTVLLPPSKTGFTLQNFYIKLDHYFVKTIDGNSWGLTTAETSNNTNDPAVIITEKKPVISKIAGISVPSDGTNVKIGDLTAEPFATIEGLRLNALSGDNRVIKIHNSKLAVPAFLCDSGSQDWTDTVIKFSTAPLKGITGQSRLELFDSKYGTLLVIPVEFSSSQTVTAQVAVTEIVSGSNSSNPFNLLRPFEIDRTKSLVLKGDKMLPSSGTYSLKYFKPGVDANVKGAYVEIAKSGSAGWTNYEITIASTSLPAVADIANYMSTTLVIWDDAANKAISSNMLVTFIASQQPAAEMFIDRVNGESAANVVTLLPPAAGQNIVPLIIEGRNLKSSNKLRLDFMFVIENRFEVVPVAFSDAAGWGASTISVQLDWAKISDKVKYGAAIVIFDETLNREITSRLRVKFNSNPVPQPSFNRIIKGVNNASSEVKLYEESWGATPPVGTMPTDVNIIYNTVPMIHLTGDSFGVYLQGAKIKFRTALKEFEFPILELDWLATSVHAALDGSIAVELTNKTGILSIIDANGAIISNRLYVKFVSGVVEPVNFALVSPSFANNGTIPVEFSGAGANFSPELRWTGAPSATASFALICEDPTHDASNPYIHWAIYDMPASFTGLVRAVPQGAAVTLNNVTLRQLESYAGKIGYDGPNPPTGEVHVYHFKLYALKAAPGALVTDITRLKTFIQLNKLNETVVSGKFVNLPAVAPVNKVFRLKVAPLSVPSAPSLQTGSVPATMSFDPSLHSVKVYDQISGTVYQAVGDPTNAASYTSQVPMDDKQKVIVVEVTEKATGNVLSRNIVGQCPLISEIPANVNALEMQNPPIDLKTTTMSMLAFEKLGNTVPNLPPFDYKSMAPDVNGIIAKAMQPSDVTPFTSELQNAVGGSAVIDSINLARQGIKEAQIGIAQVRSSAANIPVNLPEPYATQNLTIKNSMLASAASIESCMTDIKNALNMIPTSGVPNPAAATELIKAYVKLLNEISKIQKNFASLSAYGIAMPTDLFKAVPLSVTLPGVNGSNTIDMNTTVAQILAFVKAVPSQRTLTMAK